MNIRYLSVALFVLLMAGLESLPQNPSVPPPLKGTPLIKPATKRIPDYQINLKVTGGPKYFASVVSPDQGGNIEAAALGSLITDLQTGEDPFDPPDVLTKVLVEAEPNVTMIDLWNPIMQFRRGRVDISVSIPTGSPPGYEVPLAVPPELPEPDFDMKPHPLWLVVTLAADGTVSLNNEPFGTLSNTGPLSKRLQEIFRVREETGVFREGLNEVEKDVTIVMPMSTRKFSDLITIARAIWLPGGDRIALALGHPLTSVNERKDLLILPPIPPRKKP